MLKLTKFYQLALVVFLGLILFYPAVLSATQSGFKPTLQVPLGSFTGSEFQPVQSGQCQPGSSCPIDWISQYVAAVYRYGVGLAAVLAVIMIMVGGFLWLTAGGRQDQVTRAKEFIISSLTGLLLALFSFLILQTVNPQLVNLKSLKVETLNIKDPHLTEPSYGPGQRPIPDKPSKFDELTIREHLSGFGVRTWESSPGATQLEGLPDLSIQFLRDIGSTFGGSSDNVVMTVTGATEELYHSDRHGVGINTFDIDDQLATPLRYAIENNPSQQLSWGTAYYFDYFINNQLYTVMWVDEGDHYHVEIQQLGYREQP
jgi:hypothetical protein